MAAHLEISTLQIDENPLHKLEGNLRVLLDKLKGEPTCQSGVGNTKINSRTTYWNTLGCCIQTVSKECTKLSLAFTKPPLPSSEDTEALVNGLEVVVTAVFATYEAFSQQEGVLLHNVLKTYVIDLTKALLGFVTSIRCAKKDEILKTVGIVWECCESLASLPKDIKELALKETKSSFGLINDAITELEEYYQDWHENQCDVVQSGKDNTSNKLQEQHIQASIGLAKVAKSLLKKVTKCFSKNAQTEDVSKVNELDTITQTIKLLSPRYETSFTEWYEGTCRHCRVPPIPQLTVPFTVVKLNIESGHAVVDNLFCGIYSESLTEAHNEGLELASLVEKLLQLCRSSHFCLGEDDPWLDFLSQALDHNLKKFTMTEP